MQGVYFCFTYNFSNSFTGLVDCKHSGFSFAQFSVSIARLVQRFPSTLEAEQLNRTCKGMIHSQAFDSYLPIPTMTLAVSWALPFR